MSSPDGFGPGRWTYKGQNYPWALPIPPPSVDSKEWIFEKAGMCPLFMVSFADLSLKMGELDKAIRELNRLDPILRSLGRADWNERVTAKQAALRASCPVMDLIEPTIVRLGLDNT